MINSQNRIFGLDVFRATAILMVVSSHVLWIYPKSNNFIIKLLELFGFWGVELFFVLSGFLIGSILYQSYVSDSFTLQSVFLFLKRRWFRTLPNYYLVLIANIFIAFFIGYQLENMGLYFIFMQNFISKSPFFFPESWSLSVEEFAYLLLPFALFFGTFGFVKNNAKRFLIIVFLLLIAFFFAKVVFNATQTVSNLTDWNSNLKSVVIYRIDAILLGVIVAWIRFNFEAFWKKYKGLFVFFGIGIFFFLLFGITSSNLRIEQSPFFWNVIYLPLTSLGFAFFFPFFSEWKLSNSFLKNPIEFVSKISYSIYLIHYSIILQLMKYFVDTTLMTSFQRHFFTISYLIITFLMAYILNRFYEKPMMNLRDRI
ncbi:MAG TPA: acyltransferase [Flavobacterium sp.]|uniref:acyltransferase family protein n=1 Tax=Flavobacterium sp. TaxID=239 RepID=UPI002B4AB022|nr:acyltransferase [Flavobacterium sp.]HLO73647.1 acyltransferase [Flavobacterium sp.]